MQVGTHGVEERLARGIKQLQWRHHRALDSRMRGIGSTIVQWDVLRALEANPDASAHDLAVATFQSDQSLGQMMRGMESRGLITRTNPRGRRFAHQLTDAGAQTLAAGRGFAEEIFRDSFSGLTADQREQLLDLLHAAGADA